MTEAAADITEDAFLGGQLRLKQKRSGHRAGHDAILLAAATQVRAQAPPAAAKPSADQDLLDARANLRTAAAQVARVKLPMAVEPAVRFKA